MAAGAALGAAFDMLFISVVDAGQKVACFSSRLNRLNSTLILIRRAVDDVEDFNRILERPQDETTALTDRLLQGEKLVRKCSRVKWWNVFTRLYYSVKLSCATARRGSISRIVFPIAAVKNMWRKMDDFSDESACASALPVLESSPQYLGRFLTWKDDDPNYCNGQLWRQARQKSNLASQYS